MNDHVRDDPEKFAFLYLGSDCQVRGCSNKAKLRVRIDTLVDASVCEACQAEHSLMIHHEMGEMPTKSK